MIFYFKMLGIWLFLTYHCAACCPLAN